MPEQKEKHEAVYTLKDTQSDTKTEFERNKAVRPHKSTKEPASKSDSPMPNNYLWDFYWRKSICIRVSGPLRSSRHSLTPSKMCVVAAIMLQTAILSLKHTSAAFVCA
jgi:hypothetical protein